MLNTLITSRTRIRILLKFFLNPKTKGYLRQLANEFGESTNSIRVELNKLTEAQILSSKSEGRNKIYNANITHPLFEEIRSIVLKSTGIDKVISNIINKLGKIDLAFIRGDYAVGKDSGLIDLILIGRSLNTKELERVQKKTEKLISRKINVLVLNPEEYDKLKQNFENEPVLTLFDKNE
ncbi:MAG: ArsR family transcriptional regulator [Calditrichaeota bacterium]|nr:MAG: ArsR family transcriptional regulator [Calditrichota bacterium]MBL1205357.1 ArsR family transcriptional regulator [Calditrichota bacterium]NOG45186.1 winged helix-turn-helix transcriptional regulator [Calditrichota bacterium]